MSKAWKRPHHRQLSQSRRGPKPVITKPIPDVDRSQLLQSRRGVREGLVDNIKYTAFWIAVAMQFNLMLDEQPHSQQATLIKKFRDAIHSLKLRYELGQTYNKIESSQVEATRFALIWNEIIITFREEYLISDREVELLELPPNCWNIRVICWPYFLLCNELLLALRQAEKERGMGMLKNTDLDSIQVNRTPPPGHTLTNHPFAHFSQTQQSDGLLARAHELQLGRWCRPL